MSLADLPAYATEDYVKVRELPDGRVIGITRLMFHWTLHIDIDDVGYADKYCYQTLQLALNALDTWDGNGDPADGWHRHLGSGRRRDLMTGAEWIQW